MNFKEVDRGGTDLASGDFELPHKVFPEKPSDDPRDIPCVRLNADQVVEITADDYSLKIFNLTRIKPVSVSEIISIEPEPESGDAGETIQRFLRVGLLQEVSDGRFYSKFPENYVNFTDHPYDEEFESDKDIRSFGYPNISPFRTLRVLEKLDGLNLDEMSEAGKLAYSSYCHCYGNSILNKTVWNLNHKTSCLNPIIWVLFTKDADQL